MMRENPKIYDHLASISPMDKVVICTVVRGEIQYGISRLPKSKRQQYLEDKAMQIFSVIPCEPIPESAGDYYAMIKITQLRKGLALDENDLWIAATTLALGAVLVSRDSDFYQVDTLVVENWVS
ncbi:MAG: tRNA(fMet)-specific endonuclease VapC [Candidatus Poribacteria bacterium]|nr:tRNA(fMet)-specific endonuclease VapC [Candidatus Poribacteria bacterium]